MAQNKGNAQDKRAILRGELVLILRRWLLGEAQTGTGAKLEGNLPTLDIRAQIVETTDAFSINWLECNERFEVKPIPQKRMHAIITGVANRLCFLSPFDQGMSFSVHDAAKVLHQAEGSLAESLDSPILIEEEIPAVGFSDDPGFCYSRVDLKRPPKPTNPPMLLPYKSLGAAMLSIQTRMIDYDQEPASFDEMIDLNRPPSIMFDRLLSAIGALVADSQARKEILYWHGPGDDGKTTLMSFIGKKLGRAAIINQNLAALVKECGLASLEGKRFVHCEEIGRGSVINSAVKRISGSPYITGRALYSQQKTFRAEVMLFMTSNEMPIIDGSRASLSRMRYVRTRSIPDSEIRTKEEIWDDLEKNWPCIVHCAMLAYYKYNCKVLPMQPDEMTESVEQYFERTDAWLAQNLVYCPGFVVSAYDLSSVRPKEISAKSVIERLHTLLPETYDAAYPVVERTARLAKHKKVFKALHNVAPRPSSLLFIRCQLAGWLPRASRTSIKIPDNVVELNQ